MANDKVVLKCKVGSVLTTRLAQEEAEKMAKKQEINNDTEREICEFLGAENISKAKEIQLNANNEVTDFLISKTIGDEIDDSQLDRLKAIREIGRGVKKLLVQGKGKKDKLK